MIVAVVVDLRDGLGWRLVGSESSLLLLPQSLFLSLREVISENTVLSNIFCREEHIIADGVQ